MSWHISSSSYAIYKHRLSEYNKKIYERKGRIAVNKSRAKAINYDYYDAYYYLKTSNRHHFPVIQREL